MKKSLLILLICLPLFFYGQTTTTFSVGGNQTFVSPAGVTSLTIKAWGAAGAGGSSTNPGFSGARGGSGGGGGAFASTPLTISSGATLAVVVGIGGKGVSGGNGNAGGFSAITGYAIKADGGKGGLVNTGNFPVGGLGGLDTASNGTLRISGFPGLGGESGFADDTGAIISSGAGGNGANSGGAGGTAITGAFISDIGNAGTPPGGGGSGGRSSFLTASKRGGDGADGTVTIAYTCSTYSLTSTTASSVNICSGSASEITLVGVLPIGLYSVAYEIQGITQVPSAMNVTTAGTGTFIAGGFTTVGTRTVKITGLTSGSSTVAAENCSSNINVNNLATVTVNSSGTAPVASAGSGATCNQITANWQSAAGAAYYEIDVSTENTFATFVTGYNARNVGNVLILNITGLVNDTYYYRVRAYSGICLSANSNIITYATSVIPGVPTGISVSGNSCTQFTLNWNTISAATSYTIERATDNGFSANLISFTGITASPFIITGLTANTTYYYRIKSVNGCGSSANVPSTPASIKTLNVIPSNVVSQTENNILCNSFNARWNATTGAISYLLDVSTSSVFAAGSFVKENFDVGNVISYIVTGLNGNTQYYYRLKAKNGCGLSTDYSGTQNPKTTNGAPSTPTGVVAAASSVLCSSFTMSWNTSAGALDYTVQLSTSSLFSATPVGTTQTFTGVTATTYNFTGLTPGTTYYYRVLARNSCVSSIYVNGTPASRTTNIIPAVPTISPNSSSICQTDGVTLSISPAPNPLYSYVWSTGETASSIYVTSAGSYTVKAVNTAGCTSTTSAASVITVQGLPTATAGGSQTICSNQSATVSGASGSNGTIKWTFSGGAGTLANSTTLTPTYTPTLGGAARTVILTLTVTSTNLCAPQIATATYTINIQGAPIALISGSQSICSNGSITVGPGEANATNGSVLWTHDGAGILSGTTTLTPTYIAAAADAGKQITLTMTVTASPVCSSTYKVSDIYPVIVLAENTVGNASLSPVLCINTLLPNITHSTTGATGIGTPLNLPLGVSANWSANTITISGTPTESGTFNYSIPLTGGCGIMNATGSITINLVPSAPIFGTITQPTCITPTGSIVLNGLLTTPNWLITQNGGALQTYTSSGTTYTISNLVPGIYNFTIEEGSVCPSVPTIDIEIKAPITNVWDGVVWSKGSAPINTDIIEFDNDYQSTGDLTGCSCKVNAGKKVIINSGHTLTIENGLNVDSGLGTTLIFNDDASLIQINNAANTGNIIYKRDTAPVRRYDFTYWSSPISSSIYTLHDLSPSTLGDKYYKYDPINGWIVSYNGTLVMAPGMGYIVRAPQPFDINNAVIYHASFVGVPNNGDISIIPEATKWNLIGNPYPSAIDADEFISQNSTGALYFWTHNTKPSDAVLGDGKYKYTGADYAVYSLTGSVTTSGASSTAGYKLPPTGKIAAGQAFFMKAATSNVLVFTNHMRLSANNDQFFKTANSNTIEKNRVWLNLANNEGAFKQILVGYIEGANNTWDDNYDAVTINGNSYLDFYSINEDKKLTVQGRALPFDDSDLVPLGYKSTLVGDFTISIDHTDGSLSNQAIYLEDKIKNEIYDLRETNYTFTTEIGTFADRFVLRFSDKTLGNVDFKDLKNLVLVSVKDKMIKVTSTKEDLREISIFDISGKILYTKKKIGVSELMIPNLQSGNQVLLVKVRLENGYKVSKKIIF